MGPVGSADVNTTLSIDFCEGEDDHGSPFNVDDRLFFVKPFHVFSLQGSTCIASFDLYVPYSWVLRMDATLSVAVLSAAM
nr:hypothetical protein [Candidatus Freyrarchaeum guaymaensis]